MTCIHKGWDEDDSWGGCIHCETEEKHRLFFEENHPKDNGYRVQDEVSSFVPNPYYYHRKLKKCKIVSVGSIFTTVEYKGSLIDIPNKILKYKQGRKKIKVYAHKRICNEIFHKNGLPLLQ